MGIPVFSTIKYELGLTNCLIRYVLGKLSRYKSRSKSLFENLVFLFIFSSCWLVQHLFLILDAPDFIGIARMTIYSFQTGSKCYSQYSTLLTKYNIELSKWFELHFFN